MADWTPGVDSNPSHGRTRFGASVPVIQYYQAATAATTAVIKYGDIYVSVDWQDKRMLAWEYLSPKEARRVAVRLNQMADYLEQEKRR